MTRRFLKMTALLMMMLIGKLPAVADSLSSLAAAQVCNEITCTGQQTGSTSSDPLNVSATLPSSDGQSTAKVTANGTNNFGHQTGNVTAQSNGPATFPQTNGSLDEIFSDNLTVEGINGQSTTVTITANLHAVPVCGNEGGASANLNVRSSLFAGHNLNVDCNLFSANTSPSLSLSFDLSVGTQFLVVQELRLFVSGLQGGNDLESIDASSTATLFVDVASPGFSIQSASGHDYSTPVATSAGVPEPPNMFILGIALAAALARIRGARGFRAV